jgi:hypothetical protein
LADQPGRDQAVRRLADELWGPCDGVSVREHAYGRGRIVWGKTLREVLRDRGVGPDLSWSGGGNEAEIDFIHRRTAEAEIYFIRNPGKGEISGMATFRVRDRSPEFWFPDTGATEPAWVWDETNQGVRLPLRLGVAESVFVVFRKSSARTRFEAVDPRLSIREVTEKGVRLSAHASGSFVMKRADGKTAVCQVTGLPDALPVKGPWTLSFSSSLGEPAPVRWDTLKSWTEDTDPAVRYFSGIGRSETEFELAPDLMDDTTELSLDLGELWSVGEVFLNGKPAGLVWKSPYRVDITSLAKPGPNRLRVDIANTWANRLIGDARMPKDRRATRTNITGSGTPTKRWQDIEPRASGLFGPVTVRAARLMTVPFAD